MKVAAVIAALSCAASVHAATTINITTNVAVAGVRRFGIGLAQHNYYDSAQMMKELLFRNPGFEGLLFQSVVRLGSDGTASNAVEDLPLGQWPTGFWAGGTYEVIYSTTNAHGRTGLVANSIAPNRTPTPNDPTGSTQGTTYAFADLGPAPAAGDYLMLRKTHLGGTGGGAAYGSWGISVTNGATIASESADMPTNTVGQQCIRLTALSAGQQASVRGVFDTTTGFIRLDGEFRLAFKAKGVGGANRLLATVRRGTASPYLSQTVQLTGDWAEYSLPFSASESNTVTGSVSVEFAPVNQSAILLDDVSLRQTNSDPVNPTEFRDAVVNALLGLQPGILRYVNWQDVGNSLDNSLAPVFARKRSGYSSYGTTENNMMPGLHEFLVLCEHIRADPWYSIPATFTTQEVANLMEYLGGATNSPYGQLRAQRGHPAPWTGVFNRIHLEFANEHWNNTAYRGGCLSQPVACCARAGELFAIIKTSPYYNAAQFQCILGGQAGNPGAAILFHNASALHDSFCLAPYMSSRVDSFANTEELFGPLFAEPEWWAFNPSLTSGLMRVQFNNVQSSVRPVPLSIYELNLHTTEGSISQTALDQYTPSVGSAIAVADHMLLMLREYGARDQCFFALPGYRTTRADGKTVALWGAALDMGKTDRKRPHYHMVQLLNEVLAGNLLATEQTGDNPMWSVTNMNRITFNNAHALQSYAFANGADRALAVFNLQRTGALDVTFIGPNAPTGLVTWKQLTSANITDNNEGSNLVAVTIQEPTPFNAAQALALPPFSMTVLQWTTEDFRITSIETVPLQGAVRVQWESLTGRVYRVRSSANLMNWDNASLPVPGSNGVTTFYDDGSQTGGGPPLQAPQRFYRVMRLP